MNELQQAFENRGKTKVFIPFIVGGFPDLATTEELILALAECGADIIKIAIPFSDPVAEGPIMQAANEQALAAGCTVDGLFDVISRVRKKVTVPIIFMSYLNPIFVYGKDRFMAECKNSGIDGIIVPDLPYEERLELAEHCAKYGITQISVIAPTSGERIATIVKEAEGFIYCMATLNANEKGESDLNVAEMVAAAKAVTDKPCVLCVEVSDYLELPNSIGVCDGITIGSDIVKLVTEYGKSCVQPVRKFVEKVVENGNVR